MTAKRRGGVLEGLGVINPFLRLIFSVLFFCLQGVEEMFWRDYNKSFLGLLSFFGQTRKCSQRMRRCFGGTGCNKSLRSTELPGRRWQMGKEVLPHHREDHDHHDCHDHHLDIEDDKILRKGKGVLIIQTFFKLKPNYVHNWYKLKLIFTSPLKFWICSPRRKYV